MEDLILLKQASFSNIEIAERKINLFKHKEKYFRL
jgi:hypothetical protein